MLSSDWLTSGMGAFNNYVDQSLPNYAAPLPLEWTKMNILHTVLFTYYLGTIQILRKHFGGDFLTHPLSVYISKIGQFLNPPTHNSAYVIYEWSLKYMI